MTWLLVQILGIICGGIGMILTWIITIMPQWRISVLAENHALANGRIDGQWISRWDGLWTTCVSHARVSLLCNSYESMVSLTTDLKAGRVLMGFALVMTFIACTFSLIGILLTRCSKEGWETRHCMRLTAGVLYIISAALIIIPVAWTTSNIIQKSYDAAVCRGAVRIEMGEALFLAWPAIVFILIGGIIMCWRYDCRCNKDSCGYVPPRECEMECRPSHPEERRNCNSRSEYI
ncbi:PREDICTED: claudin-8-like [Nanorana parkeri]|uniref:claudin-8-like n=1 Tax=Nanorana parkeri TaxID=125878 RepID=UPI000854BF16|nr:PREDICTED: claudin-8-like [Nanorana parkeri]